MHSPTVALAWEIWHRNRKWALLTVAIVAFGCIVNLLAPGKANDHDSPIALVDSTLWGMAVLIVFGMFNYTEVDSRTGSRGFPRRLFALPLSSLRLVTLPIVLGVGAIEFLLVVGNGPRGKGGSAVGALSIGVFMVVYQTMLWICARLGALRAIALGMIAIWFLYVGFDPMVPEEEVTVMMVAPRLVPIALVAFVLSWLYVSHQRSGGGRFRIRHTPLSDLIADAMPRRRTQAFASPAAAQFWFEWRRSGTVLPISVGALLVVAIAPMCWLMRGDAESTLRIFAAVLAMPLLLSLPVGKGFSKPDFWSTEMSLPAFLAIRPLATGAFITIKMKVAALSAALAWLLVLLFLSIWLPLGLNLDRLEGIRAMVRPMYPNSSYAPSAIVLLCLLALMLLTWRFLVSGLWIGLSGSRRLFEFSAAPYGVVPVFGLIGLIVLSRRYGTELDWARANLDRFLPTILGILVATVIAKVTIGTLSARKFARPYIAIWFAATILLIVLALLLSRGLGVVLPTFSSQIREMLLLVALVLVPLARLGLASSFFEKNRHR